MQVKWPVMRRLMLKAATPILRGAGIMHMPPHYRSIGWNDVVTVLGAMMPGDVLLSRRDHEITNPLIPGYWKHAAIYEGSERVIEAIGRGVIDTSIKEFCTTKDDVLVLRARFANAVEAALAVEEAKALRGAKYDYLVEHDLDRTVNNAFYCSEVIWWSYDRVLAASGRESPFKPRITLGVPAVTPQDYAEAKDKWSIVARIRVEKL